MGPPLFRGGHQILERALAEHSSLQWGHLSLEVVVILLSPHSRLRCRPASMGPPLFRGGHWVPQWQRWLPLHGASLGLPLFRGGHQGRLLLPRHPVLVLPWGHIA